MNPLSLSDRLQVARDLARSGKLDAAVALYQELLPQVPAEAGEFLGIYALRQGRWRDAVLLLEQAVQLSPDNPMLLENLGIAHLELDQTDKATPLFLRVLEHRPEFFVSRLYLGLAARRGGHASEALSQLYWALAQAQKRGFWLNEKTTQPWLLNRVLEASAFVRDYQMEQLLVPLKEAGNGTCAAPLDRVDAFVRSHLGVDPQKPSDPRQAPNKHYVPGLPSSPWFDTGLLPWTRRLEEMFPAILEEYQSLTGNSGVFESFLKFTSPAQIPKHLGTSGAPPRWDAFFFYRHGVRNEENCRRCPRTAALLEELPLIRLPGLAPEICFSILTPGTHILPHRGDANLRSVVHLPLMVPPDCRLKVGGEERCWEPGRVLAFDDTYEHEAWNRSDQNRIVLLMDTWNPHLTQPEQHALTRVLAAMLELSAGIERHKPVVL